MVKNRRIKAIVFPLMLYCASGAIGSYFVWQASNGARGLKTKIEYKQQMATLGQRLLEMQAERQHWARNVALMRGETIDRDMLEEQAHLVLNAIGRDELVVLMPEAQN